MLSMYHRGEIEPLIAVLASAMLVIIVVPMIITLLGSIHQVHMDLLNGVREQLRIEAAIRRGDIAAWAFFNRTYNTIELFVENKLGRAIEIDRVILRIETYGLGTLTFVYRPRPPIIVDANMRIHTTIEISKLSIYRITVVKIVSMFLVLSSSNLVPVDIIEERIYRQMDSYDFFDPKTFSVSNITLFFSRNNVVLATTTSLYPLSNALEFVNISLLLREEDVVNGFILNETIHNFENLAFLSENYTGYIIILSSTSNKRLIVFTLYEEVVGNGTLMNLFNSLYCEAAKIFIHNFSGSILINGTEVDNFIGKISNLPLYINGSADVVNVYCLTDVGWYEPEIFVGYYEGVPVLVVSTLEINEDYSDVFLNHNFSNVWKKPLIMVSNGIQINGSEYGMALFVLDMEINTSTSIALPEFQPFMIVGFVNSSGNIVNAVTLSLYDLATNYNVVNQRGIIEVYVPIPRANQLYRPFIGFYECCSSYDIVVLVYSITVEAFRR